MVFVFPHTPDTGLLKKVPTIFLQLDKPNLCFQALSYSNVHLHGTWLLNLLLLILLR